jgi:hypothetical protein
MTEIWLVAHHGDLWDIDNRLIGFWNKVQSDLLKVGDYVIYYRTGHKKIMGVFKVIQKGTNLNRDFHNPEIVRKTVHQSRIELVSDNIICYRPTVVLHHLLSPVRDVRTHGGQPFHCGEDLVCLSVHGRIDDRPFLIQILHAFLREGRPNDVPRQIFHGRFVIGRYAVAAEDVEAGMFP